MKGLLVFILRNADGSDCTANGITSTTTQITLVDDSICAPFEVKPDEVYLVLIRRTIAGENYVHAEPRKNGKPIMDLNKGYCIFGGNYVTTSDSRFPNQYPIPVHDRFETFETFEHLSR